MTIIASCGHKIQDFDDEIHCSVAGYAKDCSRAVFYMVVCKQCHDEYKKDGMILYDEGEENKWLGGK